MPLDGGFVGSARALGICLGVIAPFNAHNAEVERVIPKERLLVFEASQGWGPLCAFLGVPVPDGPYPRTNTTEDWAARAAAP